MYLKYHFKQEIQCFLGEFCFLSGKYQRNPWFFSSVEITIEAILQVFIAISISFIRRRSFSSIKVVFVFWGIGNAKQGVSWGKKDTWPANSFHIFNKFHPYSTRLTSFENNLHLNISFATCLVLVSGHFVLCNFNLCNFNRCQFNRSQFQPLAISTVHTFNLLQFQPTAISTYHISA